MEAPRKMHADCDDLYLRSRVRVYLNGDMLRDIIAYDCDAGWIMIVSHDEQGNRRENGDRWIAHKLFGKVEAVII